MKLFICGAWMGTKTKNKTKNKNENINGKKKHTHIHKIAPSTKACGRLLLRSSSSYCTKTHKNLSETHQRPDNSRPNTKTHSLKHPKPNSSLHQQKPVKSNVNRSHGPFGFGWGAKARTEGENGKKHRAGHGGGTWGTERMCGYGGEWERNSQKLAGIHKKPVP